MPKSVFSQQGCSVLTFALATFSCSACNRDNVHCFYYFVGDLPLCEEARNRLQRIKADVIENMDVGNKLLAYLGQGHVISEINYHRLRNESVMSNRNDMLMDIIMRGSERGFAYFCDCLSSDVNQAYLVPWLLRGITIVYRFI